MDACTDPRAASDEDPDRFGWAEARRTLTHACRVAGFDDDGAEPIRLGENAIFLLGPARVVARIARSADHLPDVVKEIAVARWLEDVGFPAARLVGTAQPVRANGRPVTFWRAVGDGTTHGTPEDLARLLQRLHRMPAPAHVGLPPLRPLRRTAQRLENPALATADRAFLKARADHLQRRFDALTFRLPAGPVHGDADVTNVLRDADGNAVLIDFEAFALGPPEWDLVLTAMGADGYGWSSATDHERFIEVYGFDVRQWEGYEVLRAVQEFTTVCWISQNAADDPDAAAEFRKRMWTLRTGRGREAWSAF